MSVTTTISLPNLLCRVYKRQQERVEATIRRSAELALQNPDRHTGPSDDDRSIIQRFLKGHVSSDEIRKETRIRAILNVYRQKAADYIWERESRRLGRRRHAKTTWEVTLDEVFPVAMRIMAGLSVAESFRERQLANYCKLALENGLDPGDPLVEAIERLDRDNFADDLVRAIWKGCPQEAEELDLPSRPTAPSAQVPKPKPPTPTQQTGQGRTGTKRTRVSKSAQADFSQAREDAVREAIRKLAKTGETVTSRAVSERCTRQDEKPIPAEPFVTWKPGKIETEPSPRLAETIPS